MPLEFEDKYNEFERGAGEKPSRVVAFFIRHNLAKDERDANKKALVGAIVLIIISAMLMVWAYVKNNTKQEIYNFPDALISRLPPELQSRILNVIYAARK